jgi:hypothetical protein
MCCCVSPRSCRFCTLICAAAEFRYSHQLSVALSENFLSLSILTMILIIRNF